MFGRKSDPAIEPGGVFEEIGRRDGIWIVDARFETPRLPSHVRLQNTTTGRVMTIAASILADGARYRRIAVSTITSKGE